MINSKKPELKSKGFFETPTKNETAKPVEV